MAESKIDTTNIIVNIRHNVFNDDGFLWKLYNKHVFDSKSFKSLILSLKELKKDEAMLEKSIVDSLLQLFAITQAIRYEMRLYDLKLNISIDKYDDYFDLLQWRIFDIVSIEKAEEWIS